MRAHIVVSSLAFSFMSMLYVPVTSAADLKIGCIPEFMQNPAVSSFASDYYTWLVARNEVDTSRFNEFTAASCADDGHVCDFFIDRENSVRTVYTVTRFQDGFRVSVRTVRIISSGVYGHEDYFTPNPLINFSR